MSDKQPRGRSRARAKGGPQTTPSSAAMLQQQRPQPERPQQALMGRATAMTQPTSGRGWKQPQPGPSGDVPAKMEKLKIHAEKEAGGMAIGRGSMRGRREIVPMPRTRPPELLSKRGTTGRQVMLMSNYFKLLTTTDWVLYQYRVDYSPEEDRNDIRKRLLRIHAEKLGGYLFDGTMLFTTLLLNPDPMELWSLRESDETKIQITLKKTADLAVGDPKYLQLFNILVRKCLKSMNLQLVGRDYYDANAKVNISAHHMELWPGFKTSIRQHEDSILMNVEVAHKVMRHSTVLDLISDAQSRDRNRWQDLVYEAVIGSTVLTGYNNKTYRIDDIDFSMSPSDTFSMKGTDISYIDYYFQKYQIRIHQAKQPLLISRSSPRQLRSGMSENIILVPELCRVTDLTDEMRNDVALMRALADHTRINPALRVKKLQQFVHRLISTPDANKELSMWNMKLSKDLIVFSGRILDQVTIIHGGNETSVTDMYADWTKSLRGRSMLLQPHSVTWGLVCLQRMERDVHQFVEVIKKSVSSLKLFLPHPTVETIRDDRAVSYVESIDKLVSHSNPDIIMCIVPNNRADRYSAIKKKSCVDRKVPTQVVLARNMNSKGVMSIATKIGIQMNCKVGGAPWSVSIPFNGAMFVGFDVTRDSVTKEKSFGAMVASMDKPLSRYFSVVSPHSSGEELSDQISMHMMQACIKYRELNGALPSRIFIYRDGVGEGQLHYVYSHEVELIKEKLAQLYNNELPKMTFIVVTKKISTRLFINGENPPPGTVADDCITVPDRYDFFLVSQSVRQGTVSPTAYNVIYDTSGLSPDRIQILTYRTTHLYYNWSGTVRVPAVCQYAHKLAFLVGQSIHQVPHPDLSNRLFFL